MLFGGAGDDTLAGDAGDDRLDGGAGTDMLAGGAARTSSPMRRDTAQDTILDFLTGGWRRDRFRAVAGLAASWTSSPAEFRCWPTPSSISATATA